MILHNFNIISNKEKKTETMLNNESPSFLKYLYNQYYLYIETTRSNLMIAYRNTIGRIGWLIGIGDDPQLNGLFKISFIFSKFNSFIHSIDSYSETFINTMDGLPRRVWMANFQMINPKDTAFNTGGRVRPLGDRIFFRYVIPQDVNLYTCWTVDENGYQSHHINLTLIHVNNGWYDWNNPTAVFKSALLLMLIFFIPFAYREYITFDQNRRIAESDRMMVVKTVGKERVMENDQQTKITITNKINQFLKDKKKFY